VQISGAASASYTYDANGNRLTQAQTKGAVTSSTSYHWNAQDQLVRVEQDQGSGAQTLAQYRYNAGNLRAEKFLSNAGLNKATQGSAATYSPLAYERIQWDGLHARRSFEIRGTDNTQTLHSDTDAAVLAGQHRPLAVQPHAIRQRPSNGVYQEGFSAANYLLSGICAAQAVV
jgi:hypothetical protein